MPDCAQTADEAARRWRASLPREWRRSSLTRGLTLALLTLAAYVSAFLGNFLLPWLWARVGCLFVVPMVIGGLFVIGHDAAHNSLTPVGWLNRLIGRIVFLPALHPFTSWTHAHNTNHHGGTMLKGKHPDFAPLTKAEYDALPFWRRWLERVYRSPLGVGLAYTLDFWMGHILFPPARNRSPFTLWFHLDRLLVLLFFLGQCALAWLLSAQLHGEGWRAVWHAAAGVTIPFGLWIWFMGFVSFIQHTHPRCAWYADEREWSFYTVQLKSTTHVKFPWPIEPLLNNIMDHPAHHLDPTIPLYRLPQSQRLLEETAPEHSVVIHWTPWEYLRTCAACKLYDFERHCWTDFDGNPTSALNLPRQMLRRASA
jgi:omega-6 fatty acid desaturase (delta-12 desaturase)